MNKIYSMQYWKNKWMSADCKERPECWSESQTWRPTCILRFKMQQKHPLSSLPSSSIPPSQLKWGYRLSFSALRAFAGETKRNSPLTKCLATPSAPFYNIPWIFCRSCVWSQSRVEKRKSSEWREEGKGKWRDKGKLWQTSEVSVWVGIHNSLLLQHWQKLLKTWWLKLRKAEIYSFQKHNSTVKRLKCCGRQNGGRHHIKTNPPAVLVFLIQPQ